VWGLKRYKPLRHKIPLRCTRKSPRIPSKPEDLKRLSLKELDAIAWTYFSIYIRKRDCISGDYAKCITCTKVDHWRNVDAGQCGTRRYTPIKFHELNDYLQCRICSRDNYGMFKAYEARRRGLYGNDLVEEFLRYKRSCPVKILSRSELIKLIHKYKALSEDP
jgi:hypothetical protein